MVRGCFRLCSGRLAAPQWRQLSARHLFRYIAGPALLCFSVLVQGFMIQQGFAYVLPAKAPSWRWLHLAAFGYIALLFFFNYGMVILSDPGSPKSASYRQLLRAAVVKGIVHPDDARRQLEGVLTEGSLVDQDLLLPPDDPYEWVFCRYSRSLKPPRAHFDKVTRQLVLNMDHYCSWLFNVVGYNNYRHFFLTIWSLLLASVFGLLESLGPYFEARRLRGALLAGNTTASAAASRSGGGVALQSEPLLFRLVLLCSVCSLVVGHFVFWHLWHCVLKGRTTLEVYADKRQGLPSNSTTNPYCRGSKLENWRHIFGDGHPCLALLLPSRAPPPWPPYPAGDPQASV